MSRVEGFTIPGRIIVLPHAVKQARKRFDDLHGLGDSAVKQAVETCVREAVDAGQVYSTKPRSFRLYHERAAAGLTSWQRFVMHPQGGRGFVIALDRAPDITVITSLAKRERIPA